MREDALPRRRTWSRPVLVAALVAAVVGTAVGARAWLDTREEIDRTAAAVGDARNDLTASRTELASAIADLRDQRAALHAGLATLDTREGERDAAEGALTTAKNRLAELRAELDAATADLAERERLLQVLDRCVRGVVEGLNQAAVGDIAGLDATLVGVEDTCASAEAIL